MPVLLLWLAGTAHGAANLEIFNRGTAAFNAGDITAAADAFQRVMETESVLRPVATLFLAKCLRRERKWHDAMKLLAGLDDKNEDLAAGLADERRRLAEAMLEAGAAEEALVLFELALATAPDADASYGRALALTQLGRRAEAADALRRYLTTYPEGRYASEARAFGAHLERGRGPVWLQLEVGGGYDSNVYLTAITSIPVSAVAMRAAVDGGVRLVDDGSGFFLRAGYRGSWLEHVNEVSGRYVTHLLRVQIGYSDDRWLFRVSPSLLHQTVGTVPYLLQGAVTLDVQRYWEGGGVGLQYEGGRNVAQSGGYSYIDGIAHWGDAHFDWTYDDVQLRAFYALGIDDIHDLVSGATTLPLAGVAHGPGAKLFWLSNGWETTASVLYLFRRFWNAAQPGSQRRDDGQLIGAIRVTKALTTSLSAFGSATLLWNSSTLDSSSGVSDRNYTQFLSLLGVTWNVLD